MAAWPYNTRRWARLRRQQLQAHPLCQCPLCREGEREITEANTVDHIEPVDKRPDLAFDQANLQSMSAACHSRFKQSQERGGAGFASACDEDGEPLVPQPHWR